MMTAFFRTVILYVLIMLGLRIMGKRQLAELEPGELVLTMMISDLAAVPMQDFGIPLLAGIIPILTLMALSLFLSQLSLHHLRFRELICGTPSILIQNGVLQQETMRKNRYTLDELLEELRGRGISDIQDVKFAVLEHSGQLSVFPWTAQQPPTCAQLNLDLRDEVMLPTVLINDGRVLERNLRTCGRNLKWLQKTLEQKGYTSSKEVFFMTLDEQGNIFCIKKDHSE